MIQGRILSVIVTLGLFLLVAATLWNGTAGVHSSSGGPTVTINSCTWDCNIPLCTGSCSGTISGGETPYGYWWKINSTTIEDGSGSSDPFNDTFTVSSCNMTDTIKFIGTDPWNHQDSDS